MTRILAIDVSNNNGIIDWPKVSAARIDGASIGAAFIKATQGNYFVDEFFVGNWEAAGLAGLVRIAYHFSDPYVATGHEEAQFFLGTLDRVGLGPKDTYGLDQENDGPSTGRSRIYDDLRAHDIDFLQTVERALGTTGYYYSRTEFMARHNLIGSFDLARHKLWLAAPGLDVAPAVPRPWLRVDAWQIGQSTCPGIAGQVDFDYMDD